MEITLFHTYQYIVKLWFLVCQYTFIYIYIYANSKCGTITNIVGMKRVKTYKCIVGERLFDYVSN